MADKKPYISVVIPTYNRAAYISEAIDSVIAQKNFKAPYEVIVVDDGSTDKTAEVLKKYGKKIRYFKIKHSGLPSVARNFGISKARGELIAFQDSDDLWADDKLASQVPIFNNDAIILSYGQAEIMDEHGSRQSQPVVEPHRLAGGESFSKLLKDNVISTLTVIARKSAIESVGGFSDKTQLRAIEDYHLWLRLAAKYKGGIVSINKILAKHRLHPNNISGSGAVVGIERLIKVYDDLWDNCPLNTAQLKLLERQITVTHESWSRLKNESGETPTISVVMGIYKDRDFLDKAVQGILDQTFKDFELIIIDDGSQDGSFEVVSKFKDQRIRVIRQTNHGLVSVLNKGIRLARASLIARQDADDISLPDRFKKEIELISTNDRLAVVGTFFKYVDENTLEPTGITITAPTKPIDIARYLYFDNPVGHGTALIKKKAIDEVGGYSDKYGPNEDYDLWRRIIAAGWQISIVPEVLYLYRLSSQSISRTKSEIQLKFFAKLVKDIWKGPIYSKPFWDIVKDNSHYKKLASPYQGKICGQYKSQQVRLTFEFLIHGKLLDGYNNFLGALILYPTGAIRLWKTLLWAPIKYMRDFR